MASLCITVIFATEVLISKASCLPDFDEFPVLCRFGYFLFFLWFLMGESVIVILEDGSTVRNLHKVFDAKKASRNTNFVYGNLCIWVHILCEMKPEMYCPITIKFWGSYIKYSPDEVAESGCISFHSD